MQCFSPEEAIDWVDQNAKQIIGHSRKYLPFAPYDQNDFLQDAYEAALEAVEVSVERQIPFPACFWVIFKGKVSAVTPNPGSKRNAGSCSPPRTICDWSDFATERLDQSVLFDSTEPLSDIDIDQVYPLIKKHLTAVEDRVLEALLGIQDGPMKIKETARHLGCSPANIRQTLARACNRISDMVANGELNVQIVEGEIVQLPPSMEIITLEPLEGAVEIQDSQAIKERSIKRRDDPSEEGPGQDHPRYHQGSLDRKKPNFHRPMGPKILQTAHCGSNLGHFLSWNDLTDGHTEIKTSWRYNHNLADMGSFFAVNDSPTARHITPRIQRKNKERLDSNVGGIEGTSGSNSVVSLISNQNCRNGTIFLFPERYADHLPDTRNQLSSISRQNCIQNEPLCRNGPGSSDSGTLPGRDSFEMTLFRLTA